jgi:hypothetical protein
MSHYSRLWLFWHPRLSFLALKSSGESPWMAGCGTTPSSTLRFGRTAASLVAAMPK